VLFLGTGGLIFFTGVEKESVTSRRTFIVFTTLFSDTPFGRKRIVVKSSLLSTAYTALYPRTKNTS
jgi:hypothetical protein